MKKQLKRYLATAMAATVALCAAAAHQLTFSNTSKQVISVTPENNTGFDAVYVVFDTNGVTASFQAAGTGSAVKWYRYSNLGGGYAEEIASTSSGKTSTIALDTDDMGYIVEEGTNRAYFWVTNYANHMLRFDRIEAAQEQSCDPTILDFSGYADQIPYYAINGRRCLMSREIELTYNTLVFDEETETYKQESRSSVYKYIGNTLSTVAPLCDTEFTLTGDCFLKQWGMEQSITSPYFSTPAVEAQTFAEQAQRENDNEKKNDGSSLGGSAPADIDFKAIVSDAVMFTEWQISRDQEFEMIDLRFNQTDFSYTFREEGRTFVRFIANNAAGTCDYVGPTYEVTIGQSVLEIPNAFSPGASEGVNDIWKVSYRSIVSFECAIFNKWGQKLFSFNDPSQGWDGRYKGKLVPAGVYYYVIKATGADGRSYDRAGDINIIGYRFTTSSSGEESGDGGGDGGSAE